jgi:arylsulfatase
LTGSTKRTERDERGILFNYSSMLYIDPEFIRKYISSGVKMDRLYFLRMGLNTGQFIPSLKNPALFRGIHNGRYKFARYFKPSEHHTPKGWDMLLKHNQLELYDTQSDPEEITNLAAEPDKHRDLIMQLNNGVNSLIEKEVGKDDGAEHMGPTMLYRL